MAPDTDRRPRTRISTRAAAAAGAAAEALAADYLILQGLVVIERNLRCKAGELDLVCLDADRIVIVEVRQRSHLDFGGAAASVSRAKQRKIIRTTQFYWKRRPDWRERALRFDVIAIEGEPGRAPLVWIKDAFRT